MSTRLNAKDRVVLFGTEPDLSGEVVAVSERLVIAGQANSYGVEVAWDDHPSQTTVVPAYSLYPRPQTKIERQRNG